MEQNLQEHSAITTRVQKEASNILTSNAIGWQAQCSRNLPHKGVITASTIHRQEKLQRGCTRDLAISCQDMEDQT